MTPLRRLTACVITVTAGLLVACGPISKHAVMSIFFDGVPAPVTAEPKLLEPVASHAPTAMPNPGEAGLDGGVPTRRALDPTVPFEIPHSPLERAGSSWDDAVRLLPRDLVGGVDWVRAIKENLALPLPYVPGKPPVPPFTLDTLVPGISLLATPPLDLDLEILPEKAPFYKVVFPHSSHTMWLNCSSCHPGIVGKRPGMSAIFSGEYCGVCHGKVAFSPVTSCARCHVNVAPAGADAVEADLARALKAPLEATPELLERGRTVYLDACAPCHGEKGDRTGPLAAALETKPRDFTKGKFRFRSTLSGVLPTDYDLFRTITRGVLQSAMPSFSRLSFDDRFALVHFIKTFSERFGNPKEKPPTPIEVPEPPPFTPEVIQQGKTMYTEAGCHNCHGDTGKGDGSSAPELKDDWSDPIRPFDFTSGQLPKHGGTAKDMYRALMTGLQGTPMPSYGEVFENDQQAWAVVAYSMTLGEADRGKPTYVKGDIHFTRSAAPTPPPATGNAAPGLSPASSAGSLVLEKQDEVPPATFPHWFHRIRFRCTACHPGVFQMKRGANEITMDGMRQGTFCATCHSGTVAWQIAFLTCVRCHVSP